MYIIIWEYQAKPERISDFERIYGSSGPWVDLFKKGNGFLGTELLRDEKKPYRYLSVDRWRSLEDYEEFLRKWTAEYSTFDSQCEDLTERESFLGKWELILPET